MGLLFIACLFWGFLALCAWQIMRSPAFTGSRALRIFWVVLMLASAFVYLRPHEDIFGGQDGGAYLNFGSRLSRQNEFMYTDALLNSIQPVERRVPFLYYGPGRPYLSKYACGRVKDLDTAECGPWFQVAYPLAMAPLNLIWPDHGGMYATGLFTLLAALALGALARSLFPHALSAPVTAVAWLSFPLMIWHGRGPRPETGAALLLALAATRILAALGDTPWRRKLDLLLGGTALALAPLFHANAWLAVLPATIALAWRAERGRTDALALLAGPAAGVILFIWQAVSINDTYSILRFVEPFLQHVLWWLLPGLAVLLGLTIRSLYNNQRVRIHRPRPRKYTVRPELVAAGLCLSAVAAVWFWAALTPPKGNMPQQLPYIFRTNLPAVINFISWPTALAALAGLLRIATAPGDTRRLRWALLAILLPGSLLAGNFYDLFMTRYLVVLFLPLCALCLGSLASLIPTERKGLSAFSLVLLCVIPLNALRGRMVLVRTTEYRGLNRYLQHYARIIKRNKGILLGEYSRIAAPFDHLYGIPTLALNNERNTDYRKAMLAWRDVCRDWSSRPAYFITPFERLPTQRHFVFEKIAEDTFFGEFAQPQRWAVPEATRPWQCTLRLYRMAPVTAAPRNITPIDQTCLLDAGNMGLVNFGANKEFPVQVATRTVSRDAPLQLSASPGALWICTQGELSNSTTIFADGAPLPGTWSTLPLGGHLFRARWLNEGPVTLTASDPIRIHSIWNLYGNECTSCFVAENEPGQTGLWTPSFTARYPQQNAQICLPSPPDGHGYALIFSALPEENGNPNGLALSRISRDTDHLVMKPAGHWQWTLHPFSSPRSGQGSQPLSITTKRGQTNGCAAVIGAIATLDNPLE